MTLFDQLFQRVGRESLERQFGEAVRVYPLNGQSYEISGCSVNLKNAAESDEMEYHKTRKYEATITCRYSNTEGMTDPITGWAISLDRENHARRYHFERVLSVNDTNLVALFVHETLTEAGTRI